MGGMSVLSSTLQAGLLLSEVYYLETVRVGQLGYD